MTQGSLRNNRLTATGDCKLQVAPPPPEAALAALWRGLEPQADASFFQSWDWLGCLYAERFPDPVLVTVTQGNAVKGLALFNRRGASFGAGLLRLGETGTAIDQVFIEHNGPLVARDAPEALALCLAAALPGHMLVLSGIGDAALAAAQGLGVARCDVTRRAPRVDLAAMRRQGKTILGLVSSNARYQIRRSVKRYEGAGAITVRRAKDDTEARRFLDALAALHNETWRGRGMPGAFAQPLFQRFHDALIERGVLSGTVDLLEIAAGGRLIGYLLNFVYGNQVYAYQSGFNYADAGPHEKPGLACHFAAIEYYAARGLDVYDFLAGDDRYKTSFADQSVSLHWARLARPFTLAGEMLRLRNAADQVRSGLSRG